MEYDILIYNELEAAIKKHLKINYTDRNVECKFKYKLKYAPASLAKLLIEHLFIIQLWLY